jgi:4-oxalocrotonate tautomerase
MRLAMPMVQIYLIEGRSWEQKAKIAEDVTLALEKHAGAKPDDVQVIFEDRSASDWAIAGKLLVSKTEPQE